jgi:ATP-dependent Clp protease ATP-binding subunit ClpA
MLLPADQRKKIIDVADIEGVVAVIARIPAKSLTKDDKSALKNSTNAI